MEPWWPFVLGRWGAYSREKGYLRVALHYFRHPKRKTYYHRSTIPLKLRHHFKGQIEFWRSLSTEDKDTAKAKSAQGERRVQRRQEFATLTYGTLRPNV